MSCGNCVHFIFGSWWIDEHCSVGVAPTQFNIVTLKAIRGVDPSVRLICWTFTCSLKQCDKKLDKPQFRFPPHSANTMETRLIIYYCGFGWDYLIRGRTRFHSAFPLIFLCIRFLSSFTLGTPVLYHGLGILSTPNFNFFYP